jgi:alanine racemase
MGVVKADAYGHGAVPVAKALETAGCSFFATATIDEAIELRNAEISGEILIFGYTPPEYAAVLASHGITQTLVSLDYAKELNAASETPVKCHIKIDMGMSRFGETDWDFGELSRLHNLKIEGAFTHFPVADQIDSENTALTLSQMQRFKAETVRLQEICGLSGLKIHCANSGAVLEHPSAHLAPFNLVRPGIALYGQYAGANTAGLELKPSLSWYARVCQIKEIPAGTAVSYGRTWTANVPRRIAVLSAGYADGYSRALGNCGNVFINGVNAPVIGRICMDLTIADVTDVADIRVGDTAELLGANITCECIAEQIGTITYEVLCNIAKRVVRIYK